MSSFSQAQHINNSRAEQRKQQKAKVIGKIDLKPAQPEAEAVKPVPQRKTVGPWIERLPQHTNPDIEYARLCDVLMRITPFGVSMKGERHGGYRLHVVVLMADRSERLLCGLSIGGIDMRDGCVEVETRPDLMDGMPLMPLRLRLNVSTTVKIYKKLTKCELPW